MILPSDEPSSVYEIFVALLERRDELKAQLSEISRAIEKTEREVLDRMADEGLEKVTCSGRTLYPKTTIRARFIGADRDNAAERLEASGFDFLISRDFNLNRVSAAFREAAAELEGLGDVNDALPPELRSDFELREYINVGHRRS